MRSALLTHSVGQGPVAPQLLCFYFPRSSPEFRSQEVEDAVAAIRLWKASPLRGCNCCHLLPSELHGPVPVPSAREHGYSWGIAFFFPNLWRSVLFVLIPVAEFTAFPRFGVGPSALLLLHVNILQVPESSNGKRQYNGVIALLVHIFIKIRNSQYSSLNVSFKQAGTLKCTLFEAQETHTSIYSDSRNLLVFQTPQEKH